MAHLLLDNLEDDLTLKLAQRAAEHERSVEDEAREILRAAVGGEARRRKVMEQPIQESESRAWVLGSPRSSKTSC